MPRSPDGTYDLPLPDVNPGEVVSSTWANTTMADIEQALTDSLDRNGNGGMNAPFTFTDGAVGTPSIAFTNETSTGFYRAATGDLRVTVLGSDMFRFQGTVPQVFIDAAWRPVVYEGGPGSVPGIATSSPGDTLYWDSTDEAWTPTDLLRLGVANDVVDVGPASTANYVPGNIDAFKFRIKGTNPILFSGLNAGCGMKFAEVRDTLPLSGTPLGIMQNVFSGDTGTTFGAIRAEWGIYGDDTWSDDEGLVRFGVAQVGPGNVLTETMRNNRRGLAVFNASITGIDGNNILAGANPYTEEDTSLDVWSGNVSLLNMWHTDGVIDTNIYSIQSRLLKTEIRMEADLWWVQGGTKVLELDTDGILTGVVSDNSVNDPNTQFVYLTQTEYDALTPNSDTFYLITGP